MERCFGVKQRAVHSDLGLYNNEDLMIDKPSEWGPSADPRGDESMEKAKSNEATSMKPGRVPA